MKLDSKRVQELLIDSLEPRIDPDHTIITQGVVHSYGFNADKIAKNKQEIIELLNELPDVFFEDSGGGMSFIQACMDKHGNHWGEHHSMEELFCLGVGINRVRELLPRELSIALPGGVPYYIIFHEDKEDIE